MSSALQPEQGSGGGLLLSPSTTQPHSAVSIELAVSITEPSVRGGHAVADMAVLVDRDMATRLQIGARVHPEKGAEDQERETTAGELAASSTETSDARSPFSLPVASASGQRDKLAASQSFRSSGSDSFLRRRRRKFALSDLFAPAISRWRNAAAEWGFAPLLSKDEEAAFRRAYSSARYRQARSTLLAGLLPLLASAAVLAGAIFGGGAALVEASAEAWAAGAAALLAAAVLCAVFASATDDGTLQRHWQTASFASCLLFLAAAYLVARALAYPTLFLLLVAALAALAAALGLRAPQALALAVCGLALAAEAVAWLPSWEARAALPACAGAVALSLARVFLDERAARRDVLRRGEVEAEVASFRAEHSQLDHELESFRRMMVELDLSSPLGSAIYLVGDLQSHLLAQGSIDMASTAAAVLRHLLSSSNLRSPLKFGGGELEELEDGGDELAVAMRDWLRGAAAGPRGPMSMEVLPTARPGLERRPSPPEAGGLVAALDSVGPATPAVRPTPSPSPPSLPPELSSEPTGKLAALLAGAVRSWDECDLFELDGASGGRPLQVLASHLVKATGAAESLPVDTAKLSAFFGAIEARYRETPYHNRVHACDVLQATHYFVHVGGLRPLVRSADALAALVAAVCHDVDHPGRNNGFEIATSSELALLYNDQSVLENRSLSLAFQLMRSPEFNFLAGMPRDQRAEFRRTVISLVLATDMARHFELLSSFKARLVTEHMEAASPAADAAGVAAVAAAVANAFRGPVAGGGGGGGVVASLTPNSASPNGSQRRRHVGSALSSLQQQQGAPPLPALPRKAAPLSPDDRRLYLSIALKCADLANAARPFAQHSAWCRRVYDEFCLQGDEEKRRGLPVSAYCDRETASVARTTAGFLSFLALPLLATWASRFPAARPIAEAAEVHLRHWEAPVFSAKGSEAGGSIPGSPANLDSARRSKGRGDIPSPMTLPSVRRAARAEQLAAAVARVPPRDASNSSAPDSGRGSRRSSLAAGAAVGGWQEPRSGRSSIRGSPRTSMQLAPGRSPRTSIVGLSDSSPTPGGTRYPSRRGFLSESPIPE